MSRPKFTVITPCYNAAAVLLPTMESILGQRAVLSGRAELEYLVCDGGSDDGTQDLVRKTCGERAVLISERDRGMYDALSKGLRRASGGIVSYLNAGDLYEPGAFDVVADVMADGRVDWLTGISVARNSKLEITYTCLPFRYRRDLIAKGIYGRLLPFVQQESTFWRHSLLQLIDLDALAEFRLAGDFYLWRCFARAAELVIVESILGGFTYHRGQISEDREAYLREMDRVREPDTALDRLRGKVDEKLWELLPPRWKKRLNPNLLRYDPVEEKWR